jgi:NAD(P)H dehydrogenase (quinone)
MTIAITGASGQLGRLVSEQLLATDGVAAADLVLLTRDPARLSDLAAQGVDVRRADFSEPASLEVAFTGVDKVLLISTDVVGSRVEGHRNAIEAAKAAGASLIAYTSIPEPVEANPAAVVPDHAATEQLLRDSGVAWTFLRNNLYADMQVDGIAHAGQSGQWFTNSGAGSTAYVTRADCAAVAVGVLTTDGHENQAYDITGPEAWDADKLAALAAERGGKDVADVAVVNVDDAAYVDGLEGAGLPRFVGELLASFGTAAREGYMGGVTDVVERIGGRPATSLRDLV